MKQLKPLPLEEEQALLKKVRKVQLQSKRLVTELMAGEFKTAFKGQGMDFDRVREYQSGDDPRNIDWNVTARQGHPFVKTYREEREQNLMILVDHSASGRFGSLLESKQELITELTATLAFAALHNNDHAGLMIFTDQIETFLPPQRGKAHVLRLIRQVLTDSPQGTGSDLQPALERLQHLLKRRSILFIISDFQDLALGEALQRIALKHEVVALEIFDPLEEAPFNMGLLQLEDLETGALTWVDTDHPQWQQGYLQHRQKGLEARRSFFTSWGIDHLRISTGLPYIANLRHFLRKRAGR